MTYSDGVGFLASIWVTISLFFSSIFGVFGAHQTSVHSNYYSKDNTHVYYASGDIFDEADPSTLTALSESYAKDKNHVYYLKIDASDNIEAMSDADPVTFVVLSDSFGVEYAKDKNHIWSTAQEIQGVDVPTFHVYSEVKYDSQGNAYDAEDKNHEYDSGRVVDAGLQTSSNRPKSPPADWADHPHKDNLIVIDSITTGSPHRIDTSHHPFMGRARNDWFVDGKFPVEIRDASGGLVWSGVAQADKSQQTDPGYMVFWVDAEYPYEAAREGQNGVVIFKKANPSGLPQNGDELKIEGTFNSVG